MRLGAPAKVPAQTARSVARAVRLALAAARKEGHEVPKPKVTFHDFVIDDDGAVMDGLAVWHDFRRSNIYLDAAGLDLVENAIHELAHLIVAPMYVGDTRHRPSYWAVYGLAYGLLYNAAHGVE